MEVQSPSPTASTYDYVYDKDSDQYVLEQSPDAPPTKLHWVVLANLVLLFIFCFITILTSGLVFGHNVASNDCLGQSWVMFSVCHISQQPPRLLLATHHTTLHEQQAGQQTAASCTLHAVCRLTGRNFGQLTPFCKQVNHGLPVYRPPSARRA